MAVTNTLRTRPLRIIAQDPSIEFDGRILTATVDVRAEALAAGPWGHRVQVIDYDASTHTLYAPRPGEDHTDKDGKFLDPSVDATDHDLLTDPRFHAQNVYAIVMRTLARFEQALGRRVPWGFNGHQLKVVPHAFADCTRHERLGLLQGERPGMIAAVGVVLALIAVVLVSREATDKDVKTHGA